MASWTDVFSLVVTTFVFVGTILGVLHVVEAASDRLDTVKSSLEDRGVSVSREGVTLKTPGRLDREGYVDATQRGFVKALSAATVGPESQKRAFLASPLSTAEC